MDLAEQIELACLLEATSRKPGNVHPTASFDDLNYDDFVRAASLIAEPLSEVSQTGLGLAVLKAIEKTQSETNSNVNLGIALLLAPLAAVAADRPLHEELSGILNETTVSDADHVYKAIRIARPGGLGQVDSQDVVDPPTVTLREAMSMAAERDRIAEQYVTNFDFVLSKSTAWFAKDWKWCHAYRHVIPSISDLFGVSDIEPWEAAVIRLQLRILSDAPDSLVVRKCGLETAVELQQKAAELNRQDWPSSLESWSSFHQFDDWLRADGHRRNPGTTADLIAATLFVVIRDQAIDPPTRDDVLKHGNNCRGVAASDQTSRGEMQ